MNDTVKIENTLLEELRKNCPNEKCDSEKIEFAVVEALKELGYSHLL